MKDEQEKNKSSNEHPREREPNEERPLPGEYPPDEDIMNRLNRVERIVIDPDNLSRNPGAANNPSADANEEEELIEPITFPDKGKTKKSDLTKEDYEALGPRDLSLDGGDDEQLKHRVWPVDFAARDLDVPNGETERQSQTQQEDEENDHYSLGGDEKESLEDDPTTSLG